MNPGWLRQRLAAGQPRLAVFLLIGAAASVAMILYEGTRPAVRLPGTQALEFAGLDKLMHAAAHFWIASLLVWGLTLLRRPRLFRRRALLAGLLTIGLDGLFGLGVELVQLTIGARHGRQFEWLDLAANMAGTAGALGLWLALVLSSLRARAPTDGNAAADSR